MNKHVRHITKLGFIIILLSANGISDLWAAEVYRYLTDWNRIELVENPQNHTIASIELVADDNQDIVEVAASSTQSLPLASIPQQVFFSFKNGQLSPDLSYLLATEIFSSRLKLVAHC